MQYKKSQEETKNPLESANENGRLESCHPEEGTGQPNKLAKEISELCTVLSYCVPLHLGFHAGKRKDNSKGKLTEAEIEQCKVAKQTVWDKFERYLTELATNRNDNIIQTLHGALVGDTDVSQFNAISELISDEAVSLFDENRHRTRLLTISQPMIGSLFIGEDFKNINQAPIYKVWFSQIVISMMESIATSSLELQIHPIVLRNESLFRSINKVVKSFVNSEFKKQAKNKQRGSLPPKHLFEELEEATTKLVNDTFIGIASELGSFTSDHIIVGKITESEIN